MTLRVTPQLLAAGERYRNPHKGTRGMTTLQLDYVPPPTTQLRRRSLWRVLGGLAVVLVLSLVLSAVAVRQVEGRMDSVTGSIRWKTVWLFAITLQPHVEFSALDARLKNARIQWTPSWQLLHNTHYNILGKAICFECGRAPPIYDLRPLMKEFVAASTDGDLQEFVRIMQSNCEAEQRAAVGAACKRL